MLSTATAAQFFDVDSDYACSIGLIGRFGVALSRQVSTRFRSKETQKNKPTKFTDGGLYEEISHRAARTSARMGRRRKGLLYGRRIGLRVSNLLCDAGVRLRARAISR